MRKHYRIGRQDPPRGADDRTMSRYKDLGRLMYDYQKATRPLYQRLRKEVADKSIEPYTAARQLLQQLLK